MTDTSDSVKGKLSDFVADVVRWRLFDLNATAARARNSEVPPEEIENAIEEALAEVRTAQVHRQNAGGQWRLLCKMTKSGSNQ